MISTALDSIHSYFSMSESTMYLITFWKISSRFTIISVLYSFSVTCLEYSQASDWFFFFFFYSLVMLVMSFWLSVSELFQSQKISEEGSSRSFYLIFDLQCFLKSCLIQLNLHAIVMNCLFFNLSKNIVYYNQVACTSLQR